MPVERYRDIAQVPALEAPRLDPDNLRRVIAWSRLTRLGGLRRPAPGVSRFRSLEDAAAHRAATGHRAP